MMITVREMFGDIDIYLFDQILKGRFKPDMKILDAGCGSGRNLVYFLRQGYEVFGIDQNPQAVEQVKVLAKTLAPGLSQNNFYVSSVEKMPFPDEHFDAVISSAVLHFARNEEHLNQILREMWRVLESGGLFFARLASSIGIEERIKHIKDGIYLLPDGSERFLVDENFLTSITNQLNGIWLEPLKTTNVQNMRCMSTWVLLKNS
ncbi:MAG: class I SAM-dependent methyltransferase [Acidobacteriota bacterium]|nr:class I SAM-dependent methyltransferase [Acidobacteriota bacterium]